MLLALRRGADRFLVALNLIWAIPAVIVIRLLGRWVTIRMCVLESARIGHFVGDATILLLRESVEPTANKTINLFWFPGRTSNQQWARMVRRRLHVHWWVRYLAAANELLPDGEAHEVVVPTTSLSRDIYSILHRSPERFEFTAAEDAEAREWMRRHGWRHGEPIVGLAVRDSAYLSMDPLHSRSNADRWSYHDYRDSDIDTYGPAMQALLDLGYWVIRMGKIVHKRAPLRHSRLLDYPFVPDKNDLVDMWVCANCHFFVTSGSGIDNVSFIFGRPVVYVNSLPLSLILSPIRQIWVPKNLRWEASGRLLTLQEHLQHGHPRTADYERVGIVIEDLSPADISDAVMECEKRAQGTWTDTPLDAERQRRFWRALRSWPQFRKYHGYIHPESRVGTAWLKAMGDEFFA